MARDRRRFYAWRLGDREGVTTSWPECEAVVRGRNARYKSFATRTEAEAWLRAGARLGRRHPRVNSSTGSPANQTPRLEGPLPQDAVYFDSGTGRGNGTEVNVTTFDRKPLAHLVAPSERITPFGTVLLSPGRTNNYGELLACLLAIRAARRLGFKMVCGDSRLALDYWSRGHVKRALAEVDLDLVRLAKMTAAERSAFEAEGGVLRHIEGSLNPADLGFHSRR